MEQSTMGAKKPLNREQWFSLCEWLKDVDVTNLGATGRLAISEVLNVVPDDEPLGQPLFDAVTYLTGCSIAFEAGLTRYGDQGELEVYLLQRPLTESAYPGQWHLPGSFIRKGEQPIDTAARLCKAEFEGVKILGIEFIEDFFVPDDRGHINSKLYRIEVDGDPTGKSGKWFELGKFPEPLVDHHAEKLMPRLRDYMWNASRR